MKPVPFNCMFCPRCGTVAAAQPPIRCGRCGGSLDRPAVADLAEPPVPRAPTLRGEMAQRAAGVVTQVLAKPGVAPVLSPVDHIEQVPAGTAQGDEPSATWPPPPAAWEPAGGGRWKPPAPAQAGDTPAR